MAIIRSLLFLAFACAALIGCQTTSAARREVMYRVTVGQGETLSALAARFDTSVTEIMRLNRLSSANRIRVGQVLLVVPGRSGYVASADDALVDQYRARPESTGFLFGSPRPARKKSTRGGTTGRRSGGLLFGNSDGGKLVWPVRGKVTSEFGRRWGRKHRGIDIGAPRGTTVVAASGGRVEFSGWQRGYGRTLILGHGDFKTLYAHCNKLLVKKGTWVSAGDTIAEVGASGNASGAHLHFEYRDLRNIAYDPLEYLKPDRYVSAR